MLHFLTWKVERGRDTESTLSPGHTKQLSKRGTAIPCRDYLQPAMWRLRWKFQAVFEVYAAHENLDWHTGFDTLILLTVRKRCDS